MELDSTRRFSSRVSDYVRYRPGYPAEVRDLLVRECGLGPACIVADIGSGTGISSEFLLAAGATVYGVEPNGPMRSAAEVALSANPRFKSVDATAEATDLPPASIDLIMAGQAFHWFDPERARAEFVRILRPGGWVALLWNQRMDHGTPFLEGYEAILRTYSPEYMVHPHRHFSVEAIQAFLGPHMRQQSYPNAQALGLDAVRGRLMSSSYAPESGNPNHDPMIRALADLFASTQTDGMVEFRYQTDVYYARWE